MYSTLATAQQQISNAFFFEVGMAQQHQNVIGVMVQYKLRQLACWIISLLLGKISVITVIDVQDNYTSQSNHKKLIFI